MKPLIPSRPGTRIAHRPSNEEDLRAKQRQIDDLRERIARLEIAIQNMSEPQIEKRGPGRPRKE